jgi:RNA polymerase sigma factor (sigma-70 family)
MDERAGATHPLPTKAASLSPKKFPAGPVVELALALNGVAGSAERLQVERELHDSLLSEGLGGPIYTALTAYGLALMEPLVATGYIFTRCREAGIGLPQRPIPFSDRKDLVQETVMEALRVFRKDLKQRGGWQPGRGGSLTTYFSRTLLLQFANVWRRWLKDRAKHSGVPVETMQHDPEAPDPGPTVIYLERDEARQVLQALRSVENTRTRAVLALTFDGYTQQEIAEILGTTRRAVESLLRRHRKGVAAANGNGGRQ